LQKFLTNHVAIKTEARATSYGELRQLASAYARAFAGISAPRVLIALPQVPHAHAAILGTALAGGFHTPLNVAAPDTKLQRIAHLLEPDIIVSAGSVGERLRAQVLSAGFIDATQIMPIDQIVDAGSRHHLAYVIFTSGSTGMPKGVMIPRLGLNNYVDWIKIALPNFGWGNCNALSARARKCR
jgi:D-alanine--poly(phosphoribitol) ligase subunit 1